MATASHTSSQDTQNTEQRATSGPDRPGESAASPPQVTPYTVHLPGFDGPLDLLLHLIERNQLEITTISLVAVTDQFVAYLRTWDEPPLPRLAEFVAMAARLLLIKSRSLLPRQPKQEESDDADPLDDAEQLRLHLIEYKLAKEIAQHLRAREIAGLQSFARPSRLLMDPDALLTLTPPKLVGLNTQALAHVFRRVLTEKKFSEPERLPMPVVTIGEKINELQALLAEREVVPLEDLLHSATSRFAVVVTFLAVLELWHQARIIVRQEHLFGPIEVLRAAPGQTAEQAAAAAATATDSAPEEVAEQGQQGQQVRPKDEDADHD